ncbi:MAG: hypothetical protein SPL44_08150, partial [Bacteroidales bacterium]|nr:hypothetical protein [Bacteroidales bacterium]
MRYRCRSCPAGKPVDPPDGFRFFIVYDELAVRTSVVAKEPLEGNRDLAVCESLPLAPGAVLGNGSGFLLCEARHDGDQELSFAVEGPDVFLFKVALDSLVLEVSDGSQGIDRVPGKSADRLCDDQVNLSGEGVLDHGLESGSLSDAGAGDSFVGVD